MIFTRAINRSPRSGSYTEIDYAPTGAKLQLLNGQNAVTDFVPLPGGATAVYTAQAGGLAYYRNSDWLGSSRLASTPSRTVYYDGAYGPFGEPYAQSGTPDLNFTGMNQDTASNVYDFPAREYGIQGRWPSPDPAGLAAVNPMDPQTWNRYAYVRNSPLELIDPTGMAPQPPPGDPGNGGCQYAVERMDPVTERTWWECVISSSDGNTGAGSKKKVEPQTPQKQSYANCVKNLANVDSIQNLTHAGKGFLADAFLSNTFSSFIQLGQDISAFRFGASGNDIAQAALSNGLGPLAQNAAQNVPNVAVSATAVSITASENGIQATATSVSATLPFGTVAQAGAGALADVFTGKTIFDAGIALGASAVCAIPGIR